MDTTHKNPQLLAVGIVLIVFTLFTVGCSAEFAQEDAVVSDVAVTQAEDEESAEILILPELKAVELSGEPLKVVATTSIIGDVVAQVGGQAIKLTTLMGAGQDPHSYEPAARDLTAAANANVIFINGWNLEEGLIADLENIGKDVPLVSVSAHIVPLEFSGHEHENERGAGIDPHVWLDIQNVKQWVNNISQILSQLDPPNEQIYHSNAAAYLTKLDALSAYTERELAVIPTENRFLVTNHDSLGYFAQAYDLKVIATVLPGASTLAESSANELAALVAEMATHHVCSIFTEATANDNLAKTAVAELTDCQEVKVLPLYTGAIGPEGSGADSYIGMFQANVATIVSGLK